jgi:hypothetical protein
MENLCSDTDGCAVGSPNIRPEAVSNMRAIAWRLWLAGIAIFAASTALVVAVALLLLGSTAMPELWP